MKSKPLNFPIWQYHKEFGGKIIRSSEEYDALGDGWVSSPADFEKDLKKPEIKLDESIEHKDEEKAEVISMAKPRLSKHKGNL